MKSGETEYLLDGSGVDAAADAISVWAKQIGIERRNALRIRLTMEELLLRISRHSGMTQRGTLRLWKRFGRPCIRFRYRGEAYNPMDTPGDDFSEWTGKLLSNLGLAPVWIYRGGRNELMLRFASGGGHSSELILLGALIAALILGLLGAFLPEGVTAPLSTYFLGSLSEIFLRLLNTFAGLMIFLSVLTGICGVGDAADFGKIGKQMLLRFLGFTFLGSAATVLLARPLFALRSGAAGGDGSQAGALLDMVLDILPSNPVRPFYDGNSLQIIFLAVFIGVILLLLGGRVTRVQELLSDLNALVMEAIGLTCKLLSVYIFASLTLQFWETGPDILLRLWKPLAVCIGLNLVFFAVKIAVTSFRLKVGAGGLIRKNLPAMLVGYATASSASAFGICEETCQKKLGISPELTHIGIPIGNVLYASSYCMLFAIIAYYAAEAYGTPVGVAWMGTCWFLTAVLSLATPPVAGGTLACLGVMLSQLGVPAEALAISATLSVLMDFICTGTKIGIMHLELALQADRLGMLDMETLRKSEG